ncbi:TIGR04540 family protein [Clostridium botulinum]|uniref:TIGR04540 family protein n=1 Tax=Clostridium botulinum TaxID=1491 RepID=UPI001FD69CE7|nr:TIGR04540 family protein [Clostridium botulinum]MCJ8173420.1 TIGR04540 family protein [Clostridium botulinum]
MGIKIFYKNQVEVAKALNNLIDKYWEDEIEENILFDGISKIIKNNENKIIKNGTYTTIIQQRCGKRRLEIVDSIVKSNGI